MQKRAEIDNPDSAFNRAALDEPLFVLCARDPLAPALVRMWVGIAKLFGRRGTPIDDARMTAVEMEVWREAHEAAQRAR